MNEKLNIDRQQKSLSEELTRLRDEFSNEIPKEILHSTSPKKNYKVRKNWWDGVIANMELGIIDGDINDPQVIKEVNIFMKKYASEEFRNQPRTTTEDIQKANKVITLVLEKL